MGRPRSSTPTVRMIAEHAGVSPATVSRVINGARSVSPEVASLVRAAIDALGGTGPTPRTRDPRPIADRVVFVRCPYVLTDYFGFIVSGIAEELRGSGWRVELDAGNTAQSGHPLFALTQRPEVAGAITVLPTESPAELAHVAARMPLVVVDPRERLPAGIATIGVNHAAASRELAEHLVALGHRRIGVIVGPREWSVSTARRAGVRAALADVGILHEDALVRSIDPTFERGVAAAQELLSAPDPPTALMCFNDKVATGALRAASDLGLRVPKDLSLTGFDDLDVGHVTQPRLTTVRQPLDEMGRLAVLLLSTLIDGRMPRTPTVELSTQVLLRESTGSAPRRRTTPTRGGPEEATARE
ncbi:LacI family DNA-binding transcriptional regulator [Microbacterium sp. NEAU-LLC]|uniref:LacI family DNA-binding transcriptional regulator n=1 Tax=Microbacterium helvum TaxID=2773713 RepID=A0ABR8NLR9_9MICO|nr:LacI family DNA-binding transcriptional regulator [Microbacterium helvum]MBD3941099.1 LacI family DNA-binding transcriptional regulator [Microbacterium helvum]